MLCSSFRSRTWPGFFRKAGAGWKRLAGFGVQGNCHGNQRETPRGGKQPGTGEEKQESCSERIKLLPAMPVRGGKQWV